MCDTFSCDQWFMYSKFTLFKCKRMFSNDKTTQELNIAHSHPSNIQQHQILAARNSSVTWVTRRLKSRATPFFRYFVHKKENIKAPHCWGLLMWPADSLHKGTDMGKAFPCHYSDILMGEMASQITSLTIVYSTVYSGAVQRKHQSSASLAFVWGIHRRPVNSPHKWPVTRKMFPFDDVIMRCHHGLVHIAHRTWLG